MVIREREREYLRNLGKGNRSGGPLGLVHPVKPDPRLSNAKSVKAMQRKSRSLILTDPTVENASCRSLCSVRRLSKLPLITTEFLKKHPKPTQPETRSDSIHESTRPDPARLWLYISNNSSIYGSGDNCTNGGNYIVWLRSERSRNARWRWFDDVTDFITLIIIIILISSFTFRINLYGVLCFKISQAKVVLSFVVFGICTD